MANNFELKATNREVTGKAHARRLRRLEGLMPAILYGGDSEPKSIDLIHNDVVTALKNEAFYSHILTLDLDGKKEQVVLKDLQRHPVKQQIMHMDFLRVKATEAITMKVPLHFIGDDIAPGTKAGGSVSHLLNEVEIKCLPKDLPEFISVDISKLELDQALHLSELVVPKTVEIIQLSHGEENDLPVVNIHKVKVKAIEEPVAAEEESEEGDAKEVEAKDGEAKKEE